MTEIDYLVEDMAIEDRLVSEGISHLDPEELRIVAIRYGLATQSTNMYFQRTKIIAILSCMLGL